MDQAIEAVLGLPPLRLTQATGYSLSASLSWGSCRPQSAGGLSVWGWRQRPLAPPDTVLLGMPGKEEIRTVTKPVLGPLPLPSVPRTSL